MPALLISPITFTLVPDRPGCQRSPLGDAAQPFHASGGLSRLSRQTCRAALGALGVIVYDGNSQEMRDAARGLFNLSEARTVGEDRKLTIARKDECHSVAAFLLDMEPDVDDVAEGDPPPEADGESILSAIKDDSAVK